MKRNDIFVKHIEQHLARMGDGTGIVVCKICGKTIDEVFDEYKKKSMYDRLYRKNRGNVFKLED